MKPKLELALDVTRPYGGCKVRFGSVADEH